MDVYHVFGEDLKIDQNGGLLLVDGIDETNQRIIKRLCTPIRGYLWDLSYGAGLPEEVGAALSQKESNKIRALVIGNVMKESTVSKSPPPKIDFDIIPNGLSCTITYKNTLDDRIYVLKFPVNN